MRLAPDRQTGEETHQRSARASCWRAAALVAAVAYGLVLAGVVELPDFPKLLRDLADTLGAGPTRSSARSRSWRPARSSGSSRLARLRWRSAAWSPRPATSALGHDPDRVGLRRGRATSRASCSAAGSARRGSTSTARRFGITVARRMQVERFLDKHGPARDHHRPLRRHRARGRAVPLRLVGDDAARVPALEPHRHGRLGDRLHARRLHLPRVLREGRGHAGARCARARGDRRRSALLVRALRAAPPRSGLPPRGRSSASSRPPFVHRPTDAGGDSWTPIDSSRCCRTCPPAAG